MILAEGKPEDIVKVSCPTGEYLVELLDS